MNHNIIQDKQSFVDILSQKLRPLSRYNRAAHYGESAIKQSNNGVS